MDSYSNRLSQSLRDVLENRVEELSRMLVTTKAIDYADYSQRIGHVQGLREAISVLSNVEQQLGRAENDAERAPMMTRRYEE